MPPTPAVRHLGDESAASTGAFSGPGGTYLTSAERGQAPVTRPVAADEAHAIGLVNRVVPRGTALEAAVALATELSALPQTCMRHDRLSVLEQWGLVEGEAMGVELAHGLVSLESDALVGAAQFAGGSGRHGAPVNGAPSPAPARHKAPHRSDEKP